MNRQFGCTITESDNQFVVTNRGGDVYIFRIEGAGDHFAVEFRVDHRVSNHLYSSEDFTWKTMAIRPSREAAEAWIRYEYSESVR